MIKTIFRCLAGLLFVAAGANHFRSPAVYLAIMPPYLPWHAGLVVISGLAEIAGGVGILLRVTRRPAAWGLIVLLFAVLPANVKMALHGFGGLPGWVLWVRLPFQLVFVAWVYWTCLARKNARADRNGEG